MPDLFEQVSKARLTKANRRVAKALRENSHPPHGQVRRRQEELIAARTAQLRAEMGFSERPPAR